MKCGMKKWVEMCTSRKFFGACICASHFIAWYHQFYTWYEWKNNILMDLTLGWITVYNITWLLFIFGSNKKVGNEWKKCFPFL